MPYFSIVLALLCIVATTYLTLGRRDLSDDKKVSVAKENIKVFSKSYLILFTLIVLVLFVIRSFMK